VGRIVRFAFVLASGLAILGGPTACGSSGGASPQTPLAAAPAPPPSPTTQLSSADDWTAFAHDQQRTGLESQTTGLSKTTASGLTLRWKYAAGDEVYASPLVYGGLVIVVTFTKGIVTALDAVSGKVVWQQILGGQVDATPTIADGTLFIGTHLFGVGGPDGYYAVPSALYALDILDGSVRWQAPLAGQDRGSPVIANGRAFVGVSGGDPPECLRGGVDAFDEQSGAQQWAWYVDPNSTKGGSVWAPLSYDGSHIITGTGNTCETPIMTANSVVAINPTNGALDWSLVAQQNSASDDDTGGGELVSRSMVYAISKNGAFYAVDESSGALRFSKQLNPVDLEGGWGTPSTDGSTTILISGGLYGVTAPANERRNFGRLHTQADTAPGQFGKLFALDYSGNIKWSVTTQNQIVGYAAINNGVVLASLDDTLAALDLTNGTKLWSYTAPARFDASPVVVPSGVYDADTAGNVFAFTIPKNAAAPAAKTR